MQSTPASILVIGAGVIGYACALRLQEQGLQVTLVDPDRERLAASWGNAGHIATEQVDPLASPANLRSALRRLTLFGGPLALRDPLAIAPWIWRYLRASTPRRFAAGREALRPLLARALPAWESLADVLGESALVRNEGHWLCWETAASAQRGLSNWRATDIGTANLHEDSTQVLDALAGHVTPSIPGAIRFSGTAQIADPQRLADRLHARYVANGGERRYQRVLRLQQDGPLARAVLDDGEVLAADQVLVCAGVRSRELMASLGIRAPLVAERGYHLQWPDHDWPATMPPVVFEDRSMIVTRFDGGLRAAGFVEYAHVESPADPRKWQRLRQHVRELGLPVRGEPNAWFGARPTLPDYLPAIGRSRVAGNLLYAFGHQHLGLTLAAVTAEIVGAIATGNTTPIDIRAFDIARFGTR